MAELTERQIPRVFVPGRSESAVVILPLVSTANELTVAKSLATIPQVLDVLPKTGRKPFANLAVREDPNTIQRAKIRENAKTLQSLGLLVATSVDFDLDGLTNVVSTTNKTPRQMFRLEQFKNLTERADSWERELESDISITERLRKQTLIRIHRYIAYAWYVDELSQEETTRKIADDIIKQRLPDAKAALAKAESIIDENMLQPSQVLTAAEKILHSTPPKSKKIIEEGTAQIIKEVAQRERGNKQQVDESQELKNDAQEKIDSLEALNRARKSEIVFDASLDTPGAGTAAFFEELWNRQF